MLLTSANRLCSCETTTFCVTLFVIFAAKHYKAHFQQNPKRKKKAKQSKNVKNCYFTFESMVGSKLGTH